MPSATSSFPQFADVAITPSATKLFHLMVTGAKNGIFKLKTYATIVKNSNLDLVHYEPP